MPENMDHKGHKYLIRIKKNLPNIILKIKLHLKGLKGLPGYPGERGQPGDAGENVGIASKRAFNTFEILLSYSSNLGSDGK